VTYRQDGPKTHDAADKTNPVRVTYHARRGDELPVALLYSLTVYVAQINGPRDSQLLSCTPAAVALAGNEQRWMAKPTRLSLELQKRQITP
jgi:hypothetical protein